MRPAPPSHNALVRAYDATLRPFFGAVRSLFGSAPGQIDYVKRVAGLPGDHVACCNAHGQITVNGVPLHEKSYLVPGSQPSIYPFNIVVPRGRLWVLGDDRPFSADSRLHDCGYRDPSTQCVPYDRNGTIPEDMVVGRAFMIAWPLSRVRFLPIPQTFFQRGLSGGAARPTDGAIRVQPAAPYLPLAGGLAVACPLTVLIRRRRRRGRMRLHRRR